jgi:hypothetical protein
MKLDRFLRFFDEKIVASGKFSLVIHEPKCGKWLFRCDNPSETLDALATAVMSHPSLAELELDGFQEVFLDPAEDDGLIVTIYFTDKEKELR